MILLRGGPTAVKQTHPFICMFLLTSLGNGTQKENGNGQYLQIACVSLGLILSQHKMQAESDVRLESDFTILEPFSRVFVYVGDIARQFIY